MLLGVLLCIMYQKDVLVIFILENSVGVYMVMMMKIEILTKTSYHKILIYFVQISSNYL